jgi:SsrA-binding protein
MTQEKIKIVTTNRKAHHDYEILETIEAGLVLKGTEVKSLRQGKVSIQDSYAIIKNGEAWLLNMHISPYEYGNIHNHDPLRDKKLLLHKREIILLATKIKERGLTLIPLKVYFKNGKAKVELALVRGKRKYEKKEDIAERDLQRELKRKYADKYRE